MGKDLWFFTGVNDFPKLAFKALLYAVLSRNRKNIYDLIWPLTFQNIHFSKKKTHISYSDLTFDPNLENRSWPWQSMHLTFDPKGLSEHLYATCIKLIILEIFNFILRTLV